MFIGSGHHLIRTIAAFTVAVGLLNQARPANDRPPIHAIPSGPIPDSNPLKGLIAYTGAHTFPHTMEWFYLPVNAVQKGPTAFQWDALERKLDEVASRGNQACLRFYYDTPSLPSGIPAFLLAPGPDQLVTHHYTDYGGGDSPDYNSDSIGSRRFRESMRRFIAAFGTRYDGDPRIGFITVGLLGFWGEWHTYPHEEWTPSASTMNLVLDAYIATFHKTRLLVRYPAARSPSLPIGFHDDVFCQESLYEHDWSFANRLKLAGIPDIWKRQPIGGEIAPEIQRTIFVTGKGNTRETWSDCVAAVHPSWMLDEQIKHYQGSTRSAALDASKHLGYIFRVRTASYSDLRSKDAPHLAVHIDNIGIAPFYYRWKVWVAAMRNGKVVKTWPTDWDLTTIPANGGRDFVWFANHSTLERGAYTWSIRVENPLPNGKPLLFANAGQRQDGWLELGTFAAK